MLKKGVWGILLLYSFSTICFANPVEANLSKNDANASKIEKKVQKKSVIKKSEGVKASIQEAQKLLDEMNLEKVYKAAVNSSTSRLIKANSKFKKVEGKIRAFYEKYIGWDSMKQDLIRLYTKYYTAQELRDITAFYKTKTGKKVLATMSKLTHEGQMITRRKLQPHIAELKKILDSAMKDDAVAKNHSKLKEQKLTK